jgi:hypothetical protein
VTYGEKKIKDIAEGILPATRNAARAGRKARRSIHKTARARTRMELIAGDDGVAASTLARHAIVQQMWRRRQADNLSALFRWAEKTTRHISDPEDRYLAVQAVLPNNLIGRHALSHIAYIEGFRKPGDDPDRWRYRREDAAERAARLAGEHRRRVDALAELAAVELAAVNGWLKAHPCCPRPGSHPRGTACDCRPRLVAGIHDVDAYVSAEPTQAEAVLAALASSKS